MRLLAFSPCSSRSRARRCSRAATSSDSGSTRRLPRRLPPAPADSGGDTTDVDWPYFGRVEERTHYIADAPDPPFHMLWEFFAKQLIEFPPVLQDGYRLRRQQDGRGLRRQRQDRQERAQLQPRQRRHQPGVLRWGPLHRADRRAPDRTRPEDRQDQVDLQLRRRARVLAADRRGQGLPRLRRRALLRHQRGDRQARLASRARQRRQGQPLDPRRRPLRRRLRGRGLGAGRDERQEALEHRHDEDLPLSGAGGFYSSPSVAFGNVYEARNDGTIYGARRLHAASSPGSSRPRTRSTRRPRRPTSRAPSRPYTSAATTISSTRWTPPPARSAGFTTSAASCPGRRPWSARRSTPRASRPSRRWASTRSAARRSSSGAQPASRR